MLPRECIFALFYLMRDIYHERQIVFVNTLNNITLNKFEKYYVRITYEEFSF